MKRRVVSLLSLCIALIMLVAACGSKQGANQTGPADSHAAHGADGGQNTHSADDGHAGHDLQEETASASILPSFLDKQHEEIRLVYQAAGQAVEILQWMPCYCGCGESAGHRSNLNCFIREVKEDGAVVWDDHGTRCGVCLQIAAESIKLTHQGKSLKEVRDLIDAAYAKGYANPTDTPMPEA